MISIYKVCIFFSHVCFNAQGIVDLGLTFQTTYPHPRDAPGKCPRSVLWLLLPSTAMCARGCPSSHLSGSGQEIALMYQVEIQILISFFKNIFKIYFWTEENGEREREREVGRNINVWLPLAPAPRTRERGVQPRHVPQLRIKPATL